MLYESIVSRGRISRSQLERKLQLQDDPTVDVEHLCKLAADAMKETITPVVFKTRLIHSCVQHAGCRYSALGFGLSSGCQDWPRML